MGNLCFHKKKKPELQLPKGYEESPPPKSKFLTDEAYDVQRNEKSILNNGNDEEIGLLGGETKPDDLTSIWILNEIFIEKSIGIVIPERNLDNEIYQEGEQIEQKGSKEVNNKKEVVDGKSCTVTGRMVDGKPDGKVSVKYSDFSYDGYMKNGEYHGKGTLRSDDGSVFIGNFVSGTKEGKGQLKLANGAQFTGYWEKGLKNGFGQIKKPNGSLFFCEYRDDKLIGSGIEVSKDRKIVALVMNSEGNTRVVVPFISREKGSFRKLFN